MTARNGMTALINQIRGMTNAGTADWQLGTAYFWDDDHVQETLDRFRRDFYEVDLISIPQTFPNSQAKYFTYKSPYGNLESVDSGTAIFKLTLATGDQVQGGTAGYTADYTRGEISFTADQAGTAFILSGRSYDLNKAAAEIWKKKAAHYAEAYDVETDSHKLSRSQLIKQCMEMADLYSSMGGPVMIDAERCDTL